ncbi:MAG: type I 3-dehydroquinate dehydratase, partial [Planctomycetia bacterium]
MAQSCVIVGRSRHKKMVEEMQAAVDAGARLVELRLDFLQHDPKISEILRHRRVPLVATVRRKADGGRWAGSEEARLKLLRLLIAAGFDYVDLEDDVAGSIPRFGATKRIVSMHDFEGMPADLEARHARMAALDADVVKMAVTAHHPCVNFRLLQLVKNATVPTVAFGMGDLGFPSRILGAKYGSPFTYAAFNEERVVAPGLPTFEKLREVYRYDSIGPATKVFGVVGDPIGHSLSPLVHNAAMEKIGYDGVYVPWRIPQGSLDAFLTTAAAQFPFDGLSVTIPHKQAILPHGAAGDELTTTCGAANTMVRAAPGEAMKVYNTDAAAAVAALRTALTEADGATRLVAGLKVLLIGSGGVARTIAHALNAAGAIVTVSGRNELKVADLAQEVGCLALDWSQRRSQHFDVVVNATPVGMEPHVEATPIEPEALQAGMIVFDTIYTPENTRLVQAAKARGCRVATGVEMFIRQAEAQFLLFTGQPAPVGLMEAIVREESSPAKAMLREARLRAEKGGRLSELDEADDDRSTATPPTATPPTASSDGLVRRRRAVKPSSGNRLFLIGYRGCGKSSVAPLVARLLRATDGDWTALDADVVLERRVGKPIAHLFRDEGEPHFRDLEEAVLEELSHQTKLVAATGGGVVDRPANRERLARGFVVWLQADAETIHRRLSGDAALAARPSLTGRGTLEEIVTVLGRRRPLYQAAADLALDTVGRSPEELAAAVVAGYHAAGVSEKA